MIDVHSHIIFDVDDGPASLEESLDLLAESYAQGVRAIVATSHRRRGMFETPEAHIADHFARLSEAVTTRLPDLQLHSGAEIYYTSDVLDKLEAGTIPTLAGSRYALIEFSMGTPYREIYHALQQLRYWGITPMVAHIERYNDVGRDAAKLEEIIELGCYLQVNASSLLPPKLFGDPERALRKRARFALERDLVHCVASDMHNLRNRPPLMARARQILEDLYGRKRSDRLLHDNPQRILTDQPIPL